MATTAEKPAREARPERLPLTAARQELAENYVPLARSIAKPYKVALPRLSSEIESAALYGLAQAAGSFNGEHVGHKGKNAAFNTFARFRILGEIRDELQRQGSLPEMLSLDIEDEKGGRILVYDSGSPAHEFVDFLDECETMFQWVTKRQATVLRGVYLDMKEQKEIASELGVSNSRVSDIRKEAIEMIRNHPSLLSAWSA